MTSTGVSSLTVMTSSEKKALLKLVQRSCDMTKDQWIEDCIISFGWDRQAAVVIINSLFRMAKRELAREELVV